MCASGIKDSLFGLYKLNLGCLFGKICSISSLLTLFHMKQTGIVSRETVYFKNTENRGNW